MTEVNHDSAVSLQLLEGTKAKLFLIIYKNNSYCPANIPGTLHRGHTTRLAHKELVKCSASSVGDRTALNQWCGSGEDGLSKERKRRTRSLMEVLTEQLSTSIVLIKAASFEAPSTPTAFYAHQNGSLHVLLGIICNI